MQNATQSGFETVLVRIGMVNGQAFFQNANVRNLTPISAQLTGVVQDLKAGDGSACSSAIKSRCKVVQVDAGLPIKFKVDVELVKVQQCPWKENHRPAEGTPKFPSTLTSGDFRHRISYPMEMRDGRGGGVLHTNASDIGGRGCYVETLVPFPPWHTAPYFSGSAKRRFTAAMVRADPGVGME
jgi:hypothetical protein